MSFMNSEELTTGGLSASSAIRVQCAKESLEAITSDEVVRELFPEMVQLAEERGDKEVQQEWPPHMSPPCRQSTEDEIVSVVTKATAPPEEVTTVDDQEKTGPSKSAKRNAKRRAKAKQLKQTAPSSDSQRKDDSEDVL